MKFLTRGKLNAILRWAKFCMTHPDYDWTHWDDNLFCKVKEERDAIDKEYYQNNKHKYVKKN